MTLRAIELAVAIILIPIVAVLVGNIIKRIHRFSSDLQIKTSELEDERKRTEELLYQLLPRTIARKLMQEGNAIPEAYHSATIMFSDVVGFTEISRYFHLKIYIGASMTKWLLSLISNHLPLTIVGSNPAKDFEFIHVKMLSSYLTDCWWFC